MLSAEQLKHIENRNNSGIYYTGDTAKKDITSLLVHIQELKNSAFCNHDWVFFFETGFECRKCKKKKDKR